MNILNIRKRVILFCLFLFIIIGILGISYNFYNPLQTIYNNKQLQIYQTQDNFKGFVTGRWLSPAGVNLELSLKIDPNVITVNGTEYLVVIDQVDVIFGIMKLHDIEHNYQFQINKLFDVSGYIIVMTFDPDVLPCKNITNYTETCSRLFYWNP